jgi:integral membrane protein
MTIRNSSASMEQRRQIRRLRLASATETLTLLTLVLIAVPVRHLFGLPVATRIMGPVHGLAFLVYMWTLMATVTGGGWSRGEITRLTVAAFIPSGGLANMAMLRRKQAEAAKLPGK